MPEQLVFPLPQLEAMGRDAFFVSPVNAVAVAQIEAWVGWPEGKLLLIGPKGSGKSHLAGIWAALAGAEVIAASDLTSLKLPDLTACPLLIEDADCIAGNPDAEQALFHLHNLLRAKEQPFLITAKTAPHAWGLDLQDLLSRMQGTSVVELGAIDDTLLSALLVKLFADRQITPPPRLIEYCLKRMDRSFAAAQTLVAELDARALANGRPIGIGLAAEVIDNLAHNSA